MENRKLIKSLPLTKQVSRPYILLNSNKSVALNRLSKLIVYNFYVIDTNN